MANQYKRISAAGATGGGSGSSNVVMYSSTFIVGSWAGPASSEYSFTIPAATHGTGLNPLVQVEELDGSDFKSVDILVEINGSGDVAIIINDIPDTRFGGRIKIIGE